MSNKDRAQTEGGGNGGAVQQRGKRKDGGLHRTQGESPMKQENAGTEDRMHRSGGVFVALDRNLNFGAVVGTKEGAVESIPGDEGRVNVRGGLRVFSMYFWHSEGWTPRNEALLEAVVKHARTTRHPSLNGV